MIDRTTTKTPPANTTSPASSWGEKVVSIEHAQLGYEISRGFHFAVADVSFDVTRGERVMLVGPSGCGKSTLLKSIGGFLALSGGRISVLDRNHIAPGPDRAMVFQEFDQLFPWKSVLENVAYPLRRNGASRRQARESAFRHLDTMNLRAAAARFPHQLSGGMKQRVAIARALALDPAILLMDEPFGALDALTRGRLQRELVRTAELTKVTILFVTHSIDEAIALGDRIVVLGSAPCVVRAVVQLDRETKATGSTQHEDTRRRLQELLDDTGTREGL